MALLNGHSETQERSASPSQHLGKRKRTNSIESNTEVDSKAELTKILGDALELIRRYDPTAMILKFPLPTRDDDSRTIKKQKTGTTDQVTDNIEYRILNAGYQSMEELMEDVSVVKRIFFNDGNSVNGTTHLHSTAKERISIIWESLTHLQSLPKDAQPPVSPIMNGTSLDEQNAPALRSSQVLSLRSQTEHGLRQLFSGLPQREDSSIITGKDLPNGFELAEVLTVNKNNSQVSDVRKFGDVFASHRNIKSLEMPRPSRPVRGTNLGFVPAFENVSSSVRNDFKYANLSTSLWLKYGIPAKSNLEAKDKSRADSTKAATFFKSAFTTFAPSTDNSQSVVTDYDRSQQWWSKHGKRNIQSTIFPSSGVASTTTPTEIIQMPSDEELEYMVANFIDDEAEDVETKEVLEEIAELIETLVSHQAIRNSEIARGPSSASKPTKDEQNTYEMLRNQLQLLVGTLPPFVVAKLNGDQLDELNISTQILVSPPEFVGTAQVDDYTLRRNRAAQAATTASARNPASIPNRATYGTPASAYNAQARAYNNVPTPAYAARPGMPMYNTPRATTTAQTGAYTQPQYQTSRPAIHTPSIQQFQRPMTNGYGTNATPTPQSQYTQRPAQPGYQQRAQDGTAYNRGDALQKTIPNGDTPHYQQRQYAPANNINPTTTASMSGQQRMADSAIKQMQSPGPPQQSVAIVAGAAAAAS